MGIYRNKDAYKCKIVHRNIKDGKLYVLHTSDRTDMTIALAIGHDGKPMIGCDIRDFVLVYAD